MKRDSEIEQLRYTIDRYDKYLQVVDIKGNFLMAYHFFVIGGLLINYDDLDKLLALACVDSRLLTVITYLVVASSLISLFLIFRAIYPFLRSSSKEKELPKANQKNQSLNFFGAVSKLSPQKFKEAVTSRSKKDLTHDLALQAHTLSKALSSKFHYIKRASLVCYFHLFIAFITLIILLL